MDDSHVSLNCFELTKESFSTYNLTKTVALGISVGNLNIISKCIE
jgi:hypothetical protein